MKIESQKRCWVLVAAVWFDSDAGLCFRRPWQAVKYARQQRGITRCMGFASKTNSWRLSDRPPLSTRARGAAPAAATSRISAS